MPSILFGILCFLFLLSPATAQTVGGPSAFCHETDGAFTICPDGNAEWSDVPFVHFPESNSFLYADQADLDPLVQSVHPSTGEVSDLDTFMLMYDECAQTTPLGPDQYFVVNFDTVEVENGVEKLERYTVHIFTDGTIIFFEDGVLQRNAAGEFRVEEIAGQRGKVGFGPSPNCPFDHVIVEYQIVLATAGGNSYSPDPLFWSGTIPEEPELPECPDLGQTLPVNLNRVVADVQLGIKPYRIIYGDLPLDFTVTDGSAAGSPCRVVSNRGSLPVLLDPLRDLPPGPFQIATSTATATLDFFPEFDASTLQRCDFDAVNDNCFLNSLPSGSGPVVQWSTNGFQEAVFGIDIVNTGPLTFFVNLEDFSGSFSSFGNLLQQTEQFIHETLIDNLSGIDRLGLIQDPPADLLVVNQDGRRTGALPNGTIVEEIPRSGYFRSDELSAVILVEPEEGLFDVEVIGAPGDIFSLSMSVADFLGNVEVPRVTEQIVTDTIDPAGNFFEFEVMPRSGSIGAGAMRAGFDSNTLARNDDGSTGLVPLGFMLNFFGTQYDSLFVNNNGNVTFDFPLSTFTPFDLTTTGRVIIAPFFADVDTRLAGDPVRYGTGEVGGRPAFGVTWNNVDCFSSSSLRTARNFFQVILIDRSDIALGDFDIEFNYDQIQWETGQASGGDSECQGGISARVGFSSGTGESGTFFELPGSGIPGSFLDSNTLTGLIHNSFNSTQLGRYVFLVRTGTPIIERDSDDDDVPDELDNCPGIPNPDQQDSDLNGIGDACQTADLQHSTAGFLQALLDGGTTAEATSLTITEEPQLLERLVRIVDFRVTSGLTDSASQLTTNLVHSLVDVGLVLPEEADNLINSVLQQVTIMVNIDIKPGSDPNSINPGSKGVIPVAILTTDTFDATTVDPLSVKFGPNGAGEAHGRGHIEDADGDGDLDLMLHFNTQDTDIQCGHTSASLTGKTFDGQAIKGSDSINTVGCK
jgi:hypothetical protein